MKCVSLEAGVGGGRCICGEDKGDNWSNFSRTVFGEGGFIGIGLAGGVGGYECTTVASDELLSLSPFWLCVGLKIRFLGGWLGSGFGLGSGTLFHGLPVPFPEFVWQMNDRAASS